MAPEKAKEMIIESRGIIVVATRRDRLSEGGFTMPNAVRDELLIGFALEKPCYVFVEEGVKIDGIESVKENEVKVKVKIVANAAAGARDVTITNPGAAPVVGRGLLKIERKV